MPTGVYCRNKNIKYGMTGKNHSFESKKKIGESSKGRNDGEKNFFFGKKHTEESKRKISISKKGKRVVCGEKHWNWKGGITPIQYSIRNSYKYRQWRSDVFTRDEFTCQNCGIKGGYLQAHHIKSFSDILEEYKIKTMQEALSYEELWNINNGITLCEKCHKVSGQKLGGG